MHIDTPTHSKQGLIRSFIVIVFGILFLSFIGFDIRGKVADFQEKHQDDISAVKQVLFDTIIPTTEDALADLKEFADENNITVENALKLFKEYKDKIPLEDIDVDQLKDTVNQAKEALEQE